MNKTIIHPTVRIGHVHLRVADLKRATAFYRDQLGFTVTINGPDIGPPAVFLAAGNYHHHIALHTFVSQGGTPPRRGIPACTSWPCSISRRQNWPGRCNGC